MRRYIGPIKWLGGIAILLFVVAIIFEPVTRGLSEEMRRSVLLQAIPFFATFVGILLLFILLIVMVALRFNGKVPGRTYQGIEYTIIAGILVGVICLFQPWSFVPYRYGFILVLVSTLGFILWSHILPPRVDFEAQVAPLASVQHVVGGIAGGIVLILLIVSLMNLNGPKPPYGLRERVFNSYDEERKAQVAAEATQEFQSVETPFIVFFSLFPSLIMYFVAREAFGKRSGEPRLASSPVVVGRATQ